MGTLSLPSKFKIDYPYYGLFGTANVNVVEAEGDVVYECQLLNGGIVCLKKTIKWLDVNCGDETPLARLLGTYIEEYMKERK
ncbi:MAG: hypothetical protein H0U44_00285 [Flavisolibacter sp.]|jgi:hypothetical protein|nr:hypothetical protein [Flavisolibacter sp.]